MPLLRGFNKLDSPAEAPCESELECRCLNLEPTRPFGHWFVLAPRLSDEHKKRRGPLRTLFGRPPAVKTGWALITRTLWVAASVSVPRRTVPAGYGYLPEHLVIAAWPMRRGAAAAQAHLPGGVSCGSVPGLGIGLDSLLVGKN